MSQLKAIQAAIAAQLSATELQQVYECQVKMEELIAAYPGTGVIAVALIGAKLAEE